ncbi:MAG: hypothetical protein ABII90_01175 [Bacteroidota bacterium]
MGLTIHYQGSLTDRNKIDQLRDELIDISNDMGWKYTLVEPDDLDDDSHPPLYGIVIDMENGCESLSFIFDKSGRIRSLAALMYYDESAKYQLTDSIKTQFASPDEHICIINLLRYIKKVYIKNLKVFDEGEYWESSNKDRLVYLFDFLNQKIQMIGDILEANKSALEKCSDQDILVNKLSELFKKHFGPDIDIKQINAPD